MKNLATLQREFKTHVLSGAHLGSFNDDIVSTPAAASSERLDVYTHAYRARLVEVLGNDFPGLRAMAGVPAFERLCRDYIESTPSAHANVRWYGERLAIFLRETSPWSDTLGLADMAALEWAIGLSFDAADEKYATAQDVAAISPEQWPGMRLLLGGAIRRITLCWNVSEIRLAVDRNGKIPSLRNLGAPEPWIVSRQDYVVHYRKLEVDEAAALDAVERNASFADLCEILCEWHAPETVALRTATLFKAWIQNQWIARIQLGD